ncbi:hypothetical protein [Paenibacillus borealis]|uniref:hypothetical protein n=1 Tax=Paenibacillus borealis TaxID=160799 RepID=UPI00316ACC20
MQQFMIGQYGGFDYSKFHKDFKAGFYGIEACSFKAEEDCRNLIAEAQKHQFHTGVHFPLRADATRLRDALFLSPDAQERAEAFEHIQEELDYMVPLRPEMYCSIIRSRSFWMTTWTGTIGGFATAGSTSMRVKPLWKS